MNVVVAIVAQIGDSGRLPVECSLSDLVFERDWRLIIHHISRHARCLSLSNPVVRKSRSAFLVIIVLNNLSIPQTEVLHVSIGIFGCFAGSTGSPSLIGTNSSAISTVTVTITGCLSPSKGVTIPRWVSRWICTTLHDLNLKFNYLKIIPPI